MSGVQKNRVEEGGLAAPYSSRNGQTGSCRALRGGDGSRHSRCRCRVLQKPILGTADSEYWHCLGVRSFLLEIPQASMKGAIAPFRCDCADALRTRYRRVMCGEIPRL